MKVTRVSMVSGKTNTMDLPINEDQLIAYTSGRGKVQDIFPTLSADQREFIMSGITPTEWDETFKPEEEEC